jgi:hypothetical protein
MIYAAMFGALSSLLAALKENKKKIKKKVNNNNMQAQKLIMVCKSMIIS